MSDSSIESRAALIAELAANGVRHTPEDIVWITRIPAGQVVFLELGNELRGLRHIKIRNFEGRGISPEAVPEMLLEAVRKGRVIGLQGNSRQVYKIEFDGLMQYVSIEIADNGFIVSANPTSKRLIRQLLDSDS